MKLSEIEAMFFKEQTNELEWVGTCHCCKKDVLVEAINSPEGITILGGAIYRNEVGDFLKCESCYSIDPVLKNYQPCDCYSRVVGYMRPVSNWNDAKQEEFKMRKEYAVPEMA